MKPQLVRPAKYSEQEKKKKKKLKKKNIQKNQ